jgi:hypothetical protein
VRRPDGCLLLQAGSSGLWSLMVHTTASPVIQTIIDALHVSDPARCTSLCQKIAPPKDGASGPAASSQFKMLLTSRTGSHVVRRRIACTFAQQQSLSFARWFARHGVCAVGC